MSVTRQKHPLGIGAELSSFSQGREVGHGILQRLVAREKVGLQKRFLETLRRLPIAGYVKLCGSGALHGVYLHKRWPKDLDFEAPYIVSQRFLELAKRAGMHTLRSESDNGYVYSAPGCIFPHVRVGIEIFPQVRELLRPEIGCFDGMQGAGVPVYCQPLHELLLIKLGGALHRNRPVDYVDLWLGFQQFPEVREKMRALLSNPNWDCGRFTPPRRLYAIDIVKQLEELEEGVWLAGLSSHFAAVPDRQQVCEELKEQLSFFHSSQSSVTASIGA